ncbi:MAG TPA: hypothetical protein VFS00_11850 [Polyangiaceae bacterium]|nr:hypothetical protein [Polyangiaceae bacterium]
MGSLLTPEAAPVAVKRAGLAYGWAYELPAPPAEGTPLWGHLEALSRAFYELTLPPDGVAFLCRLFDHGVEPGAVRFLFAALQRHLPRRHPGALALNLPIEPADPLGSAFPLHADLFLQPILLTVFHRVPAEETGASTFLPVEALYRLLGEIEAMPAAVAERVRTCFDDRSGDHFDELVDLLYDRRHPWAAEVWRGLRAAQHRATLRGGEGYVLDDRRWLHGRERQRFRVETDRLCRVVFDTAASQGAGA